MTSAEFEREYAARSGTTVERLRALGRIVVPCDCDYELTQRWHSTNARDWWEDQWWYLTGTIWDR